MSPKKYWIGRNRVQHHLLGPRSLKRSEIVTFLRVDKLQAELPIPKAPNPNAGAALQELLGGKYGEMSTLNNYMFQSFNFRSKSKLRPFYSPVAAITAEELGHVELVSNGVAMLNNGPGDPTEGVDLSGAPFEDMQDIRLAASFLSGAGGAMPMNSNGASWNMDFVTSSGNVIMDLLHNFHLECGARLHKLRVYETMPSRPGGKCADICSSAGASMPMPMRWPSRS
jgi:Mn-containing catalase